MEGRYLYYPKQIPYLLDKEFQENIKYKEYHVKELSDCCMCIWQMQSKKVLDKTIYNYILPDACIDIVIDFSNKSICFAGFSKETMPFELNKKIDYMGVRLKPGLFYHLFKISADKIMDHTIPFSKIENVFNLDEIFTLIDTKDRIRVLKNYLLKKTKDASSNKFIIMVEQLYQNPKEQNVIMIAGNFGCHKRHLQRIFKTNYGVSPKVLLNILRLHLCLTLMLEEDKDLMDIASICGFYDQSHFIKEVKRYTGFSPLKLLEDYR